ncbi:MAG: peptidase M20 [Hyphomicrobiales bacterium]|nr:MAG: peptidase M20 [Hyphomicrobiales bacterium]
MKIFTAGSPSDLDIQELIAWRHELHKHPELSGEEKETAQRVCEMLAPTKPDQLMKQLGGHGVAAVYDSGKPGLTVLFRCELDALPIQELGSIPHRSTVAGKSHLCGHDGHSAILLGLARQLANARPATGRVVLLFQPAEENGVGAAAVIADPRFVDIQPEFAFSLHNSPGTPIGVGVISSGPANCASRGISIRLTGSTAHAAKPESGRSPMRAVARLMPAMEDFGSGGTLEADFSMITVTHASMGAVSFGVAPAEAKILATLRTVADAKMAELCKKVEARVKSVAQEYDLDFDIEYDDVFLACTNDAKATQYLHSGLIQANLEHQPQEAPHRASEDFGRFGANASSAMLFLGAGTECPQVHTPEYDFPDELIGQGIVLFSETLIACMKDT